MGVVGNPILNESDLPFLCTDGRTDTLGVEQKCRGESGGLVNVSRGSCIRFVV